uniref:Uncharacterized protein n=2 Tax=Vitis vinifera TaxID=29760 RepID=F6I048_VITVI
MDGLNGWNHHLLEADTSPSMLYNVPTQVLLQGPFEGLVTLLTAIPVGLSSCCVFGKLPHDKYKC